MELKMQSQMRLKNKDKEKDDSSSSLKRKIEKGEWGTGGMVTKLKAARFATCCGIYVIIMSSLHLHKVIDMLQIWKEKQVIELGTLFVPINGVKKLAARQRWLLGLSSKGKIYLDCGAVSALFERKSLFAVGVKKLEGNFARNDVVTLCEYVEGKEREKEKEHEDYKGKELAQGRINYSSVEMHSMLGKKKQEIEEIFGESSYIVDRENIVLLHRIKADDKKGE